MTRQLITVTQRSATAVSRAELSALTASARFGLLLDGKVLSLERRGHRYALRAGAFVGQAVCDGVTVRVTEKVAGSFAAVLAYLGSPPDRVYDAPSFAADDGTVLDQTVAHFLGLTEGYLAAGRDRAYVARRSAGGPSGGRLLVAETARLWAAGRTAEVCRERQELSPRTPLNELVGLALYVADGVPSVTGPTRRRGRATAAVFDAVGWSPLTRLPRGQLADWCRGVQATCRDAHARLAGAASAIVIHLGVTADAADADSPVAGFVDLERLFEECVRTATTAAASDRGLAVTDSGGTGRPVFPDTGVYRTEPDVVVWRGSEAVAVVDAKYKVLSARSGRPSAADVHQLLTHAAAWGTKTAALLYPAGESAPTRLGRSDTGVTAGVCGFDVRRPVESAGAFLDWLLPAGRFPVKTTAPASPGRRATRPAGP